MADGNAVLWAFALACPSCAAGVVLTPFEAFGIAAEAKILLAGSAAVAVAAVWAANAWHRRETA